MFGLKRFVALAAFCVVAALSINCNSLVGDCDFAHGMEPPVIGSALVIR